MTFHSLRFDRAASTYGAHAQVQEAMAADLIGLLPDTEIPAINAGAILEMGCGTGLFTRRIRARFPDASMTVTDAAPRMLETARAGFRGSVGSGIAGSSGPTAGLMGWSLFDASGLASSDAPGYVAGETGIPATVRASAPYALAASSALVQWFPDLVRHFTMTASLLAPSGSYLVSGFARDNFPELNSILEETPFEYPEYPGHTGTGIRAAAAAAGFKVAAFREDSLEVVLPSAQAFLDSIRGMGSARRPETERPLTRTRLRHLLDTYQERYPKAGGVRATWRPWYAWLRKTG
ncbi:MAG: bioD [Fibrobacteres bacterium]|nr:bioD [Fibrobacterota bacterium]